MTGYLFMPCRVYDTMQQDAGRSEPYTLPEHASLADGGGREIPVGKLGELLGHVYAIRLHNGQATLVAEGEEEDFAAGLVLG